MANEYVAWLEDLGSGDVGRVGGKNASLGEMIRSLKDEGVRVPDGFATTADAYREYIEANDIGSQLRARLDELDSGEKSLHQVGTAIRRLFLDGEFPKPIGEAIARAYRELSRRSAIDEVAVAVRSSATAEDLPEASFAGQQESFLNVRGERRLLDACRRCYASLFTDRAISYRESKGFDHLEVALSVGVQKMVRADLAGSGVMFSIYTETGFPDVAVISAAWGLGENVVQGAVNPDKCLVFKPLVGEGRYRPIIEKTLGEKAKKMVYAEGGSGRTRNVNATRRERGPRTARTATSTWSRPAPRRSSRPSKRRCSRATGSSSRARPCCPAPPSARRSPHAQPASSSAPTRPTGSRTARSWSPR
jgi:pyruvate,water dikinase